MQSLQVKKTMQLEPVSIFESLKIIEQMFDFKLKNKDLTLSYSKHDDYMAMVDKSSFINSVLANIVSNAIKFSYRGESIMFNLLAEGSSVRIIISNKGPVIPSKKIETLFNFDKPTTSVGTEGEKGTGFGLPIVKKYIELYSGSIKVESDTIEDAPPRKWCD